MFLKIHKTFKGNTFKDISTFTSDKLVVYMFIFLPISGTLRTPDTVRKFQINHQANHLVLTFEFPVAT